MNYSSWLSASPDIADDIRIICEILRPIVLMECFWRTGLYMESSIAPALFHTMIEIAETGEKEIWKSTLYSGGKKMMKNK